MTPSFKELKSRFGLDEINTTDAYIIEALIIMAAISLMMSRVIVDELRSLEARQREVEAAADADESASRLLAVAVRQPLNGTLI